jgi:cytochrome bd-type quinol oxidase subunit 2
MNIVKKISYGAGSMILAAPMAVFAANSGTTGFVNPGEQTGLPQGSLLGIITSIMNWLLVVVGILGVIGFVIAGILYLTAAGDEGRIDKAKNAMVYSIVGVIVALIGVVVIQAVQGMLSGQSSAF